MSACSGANYTLAGAASTSVANTTWGLASDQSAALNTIAANNPGRCVILPAGVIGLDATPVTLNNVCLKGQDVPGNRTADYGANANQGTTLLLLSTSVSPFIVKASVTIDGINFFWPGQSAFRATPVVYPALLNDDGVTQFQAI